MSQFPLLEKIAMTKGFVWRKSVGQAISQLESPGVRSKLRQQMDPEAFKTWFGKEHHDPQKTRETIAAIREQLPKGKKIGIAQLAKLPMFQ